MDAIANWFSGFDSQVQAAVIAAIVALAVALAASLTTPLKYIADGFALRYKLNTEYRYEQRKKLRTLIGSYHGRMLEAAETLNHRIWNLYKNQWEGWHDAGGDYRTLGYYFRSTVYRFMLLCTLNRQFECEAVYIDSRIADRKDLVFVKYLKALTWTLTDAELFDGLAYNNSNETDHFFRDRLRERCDQCCQDDSIAKPDLFAKCLEEGDLAVALERVLAFFDGVNSGEERLRWDRIVVFHLFLMAFINTFGYDMQRSTDKQFAEVTLRIRHQEIVSNVDEWITRLGLAKDTEARRMRRALSSWQAGETISSRKRENPG